MTLESSHSATSWCWLGNMQRIELRSWQIEEKRTVRKPFAWKAGDLVSSQTARREPSRRQSERSRQGLAGGDPEPAEWTIEHIDPVGNRHGSAGIFADAQNEVLFDNVKVTKNCSSRAARLFVLDLAKCLAGLS